MNGATLIAGFDPIKHQNLTAEMTCIIRSGHAPGSSLAWCGARPGARDGPVRRKTMNVRLVCPHCGDVLEADARCDGMTLPCPTCQGLVTLQVVSAEEVVGATIAGVGLAIIESLFGLDE
jgi:hypothetical protein